MRRVIGIGLAVVAMAGAAVMGQAGPASTRSGATQPAKVLFTVSKETTVVTAPLRADGTPDYVAALNERYGKGVTAENNGFVAWLKVVGTGDGALNPMVRGQVLKMCGAGELPAGAEVWVSYEAYLSKATGLGPEAAGLAAEELAAFGRRQWSAEEQPLATEFLREREKLLALAVEASRRPRWWIPVVAADGRSLASTQYPPALGLVRDVGRALCVRATLRAKAGDAIGAESDVMAVKRLARQLGGGSMLLERFMGLELESLASETIGAVAGGGALTEGQCKAVLGAVDELQPLPGADEVVDACQRWFKLDLIVNQATRPTTAPIPNLPDGLVPGEVDWDTVLKGVNALYDRQVREMQSASTEEKRAALAALDEERRVLGVGAPNTVPPDLNKKAGETRKAYTARVGSAVIRAVNPSLENVQEDWQRVAMQEQMARVVLAAAEYKAKTGRWPGVFDDLVPGYLKAVPRDMYSEGGMFDVQFSVSARGIWVYSVGRDAKDELGVGVK